MACRLSFTGTRLVEVGHRRLLLGLHGDDAFVEIFVIHFQGVSPKSQHARFDAHRLQLRRIEVVGTPGQLLEVDVRPVAVTTRSSM